jgi:cytochrome c biogenesis protein CcmG/thiol:disulfide interchange protein DsbE
LFIITMVAALTGCSPETPDQQTQGEQNPQAEQQTSPNYTGPLDIGDSAPDFQLARLDGSLLRLSELRGKAVLVDFWATWCGPCRQSMPHLQQLSEEYADRLVIVGIAMDRQGKKVVAPFVDKQGITFEIVLPDTKVSADYGGIKYLPTTFLVDPAGRITAKWVGLVGKEAYKKAIHEALVG